MAQLMPLPLTVSCFSKIQTGFTFLVAADPSSPGKRAVKRVCVCVCVRVCVIPYSMWVGGGPKNYSYATSMAGCCVQLSSASADSGVWIAARFDAEMPEQLKLGDNSFNGGFVNRELHADDKYRVFVRAYTADDVSFIPLLGSNRCALSATTLLAGRQEERPACKN